MISTRLKRCGLRSARSRQAAAARRTTTGATPTQFDLTFAGQTTAAITYTGTAATDAAHILADLRALSNIGNSGVSSVTANADDTQFTVTFAGALGVQNTGLLQVNITQSTATATVTDGVSVDPTQILRLTGTGIVGTGVGLYLVKMAVDLHGGYIEVTSREGEGSRFTVRLPRAALTVDTSRSATATLMADA